ncbi:Hint domain-containing protein [Yoonia sp.]|uniref:Hint domain-containing protein n=1 Tax=Yoonia sp. TaxID=2212373 RepID=UPI00391A79E3
MATTFNVFYLGVHAIIDPIEGNQIAENASALVGLTVGDASNPLFNNLQTLSPGSVRFDQPTGLFSFFLPGSSSQDRAVYNQDNNIRNETFRINNGADQVFDAGANYTATLTYTDGTTASISAVVFQDTAGRTYLGPPQAAGADLAALTAKPIRSITLNSVAQNGFVGLVGDRPDFFTQDNILTCYVTGTAILTPTGEEPIETLAPGDLVITKDHGPRPIRWIGKSTVKAMGKLAPVRIAAGALGPNLPARDLLVSRQHRMLVASAICKRMFGADEILIPAIKLIALPGVDIVESSTDVTYVHLMTDTHDVIFAEGAPSETLLTGAMAIEALGPDHMEEIAAIFPDLADSEPVPARLIARGKKVDQMIARHQKNGVTLAA